MTMFKSGFNLDKYNADEIPDKPAPIIQTSHCKLSFNLLVLRLNALFLRNNYLSNPSDT